MGYGSDADVLFVHRARAGADEAKATAAANAVAHTLRRLLAEPAPDPAFEVDADLRPEGRQGALVAQPVGLPGVLRALGVGLGGAGAAAGRAGRRRRASWARSSCELVDPLRYPAAGLTDDQVAEIRRIKARVERERLPRGADPATHTKLGRGGLADVEWTVQLLQLQHARRASRRCGSTADHRGAGRAGATPACSTPSDAVALRAAWELATRARNAVFLVRGRPSDQLPRPGLGARRAWPGPAATAADVDPGRVRRRLPPDHPPGPRGRRAASSTARHRRAETAALPTAEPRMTIA